MRIITEKDKAGLLVAFRAPLRTFTGERLSTKAGAPLMEKALDAGLTIDEILNPANFERVKSICGTLSAADYIDTLCARGVTVLPVKDEEGWYDSSGGFALIAEAAHDFFQEVTGRGGKWNTPAALTNLAKAIRAHSLQAVLSEKLMTEVCGTDEKEALNWFNYIQALARDFNSYPVDESLTEPQQQRRAESEGFISSVTGPAGEPADEADADGPEEAKEDPDLAPYPDPENPFPETEGKASMFLLANNPADMKYDCIRSVLGNYNPRELEGLIATIDGGEDLTVAEIIRRLADGKFDPSREDDRTRGIHRSISGDLLPSFIECVRIQGVEMDEELATKHDILHDSWDLRDAATRKLHKLKKLILTSGDDDQDLLDAIPDLELLYTNE